MKDIIVFGSDGHAKVIIDIIEKQGSFKIVGLIDKYKDISETIYGYKVIGREENLLEISTHIFGGIIAIGDNWARHQLATKIRKIIPQFKFITAIHPFTSIGRGVMIEEGSVVMAGAIINSETKIGNHCIINTNASIDHDNSIGNFASIAPNATTGGNVRIGNFSAISIGAIIIQNIEIGDHTVVGAGSIVTKEIPSFILAYGAPAKEIRKRKAGDKYLSTQS